MEQTKQSELDILTKNRSSCIYGPSGSYKTANLGFIALWMYQWTKQQYGTGYRSRLITFDNGGFDPLVPYIKAGFIDPFIFQGTAAKALPTLEKLSKGYWPDALKGNDQKLKDWVLTNQPVGAYLIEGITSACDKMMECLNDTGPKLGSNASFEHKVKDEDGNEFQMFGASQTYYGHVQNMLLRFLGNFNRLPNVERIVWTALESEGEDEVSSSKVLGPQAKGKALTGSLPQKFGECIHFEPYVKDTVKGAGEVYGRNIMGVRAWFKPHPQAKTGRVYAAKPRVPSFMVDELDKLFPKGYVELETDKGVEQLFAAQMKLIDQQADQLTELKQQIDKN